MKNSHITLVKKVGINHYNEVEEILAIEDPLEINLRFESEGKMTQRTIAVTMRTPGNDFELAAGFLFTEAILTSRQQIKDYRSDTDGHKVFISLNEGAIPSLKNADRNFYTSSSCGVCGKSNIESIRVVSLFENHPPMQVDANLFQHLEKELLSHQMIFSKTGGLHASALFNSNGRLLTLYEDVGRHNALDKLIGDAFLSDHLPLHHKILLLSGRASFELIQKAACAGIPIVAAVGAPSSLAVDLAKETGITLIGFLRHERFNIYAGEERIQFTLTCDESN